MLAVIGFQSEKLEVAVDGKPGSGQGFSQGDGTVRPDSLGNNNNTPQHLTDHTKQSPKDNYRLHKYHSHGSFTP